MPVAIRSARASDRAEVPQHWEACRLRTGWWLLGLGGGLVAALAGIAGMVLGEGSWMEALGAALAAVGGLVAVAAFRCRRWTVSVGREWVRSELGPFVRTLPRRGIASVSVRPASGFRRLYAQREVAITLAAGSHRFRVPSADPETLAAVFDRPEPPVS